MTNNTKTLGRQWLNALQVFFGVVPGIVYLSTFGMNSGNAFFETRDWFCVVMAGVWLVFVIWNGVLRRRDRKAAHDDQ